ncbi:MAG: hypothetical protein V3U84_08530 [Thiotrichaceae bacterium]
MTKAPSGEITPPDLKDLSAQKDGKKESNINNIDDDTGKVTDTDKTE